MDIYDQYFHLLNDFTYYSINWVKEYLFEKEDLSQFCEMCVMNGRWEW